MKWICVRCKAINPEFGYECHNCGLVEEERTSWTSLTNDQKKIIVETADQWFVKHADHVRTLLIGTSYQYAPSGFDLFHPELWKDAHWKWYLSLDRTQLFD